MDPPWTSKFSCEIKDSSLYEVATRETSKNFLEEERRLFYVSLTRAKRFSFLFSVAGKHSMFLDEIESKIRTVSVPSENYWRKLNQYFLPINRIN